MASDKSLTISVLAGIQCLYQLEFYFMHRPNKSGQVMFITDKFGSNLFQFMKLMFTQACSALNCITELLNQFCVSNSLRVVIQFL